MGFPTTGYGSGWEQTGGTGEIEFALKHFYLPAMEEQKNNARVLLANLERNEEDVSGDYAYIPILLGRNWGIGMRKDREALPQPGYQRGARTQIPMRYSFGSLLVTLHAMTATKSREGSYARVLDVETEGLMEDLPKDINRQLIMDGTGALGRVSAIDAGPPIVITLDNEGMTEPAASDEICKYFEVGQRLEAFTGSTQHGGTLTVIAVDESDNTVDVTGTITGIADDDYLYLEGNKDIEITGLLTAISSAGTYQGIDRAAAGNERWQANQITQSPAADITEEILQQGVTACEKASGMRPNIAICSFDARDKLAFDMLADRRFVNTTTLKGGFSAIDYNGLAIVPDPDKAKGTIPLLNTKYIALYQQAGLQFMDDDGSVLSRKSGYAAYEATLYWFFEMGMRRCNVSCSLRGLNQ